MIHEIRRKAREERSSCLFVLVRVISWIVHSTKGVRIDPRNHTKFHEQENLVSGSSRDFEAEIL